MQLSKVLAKIKLLNHPIFTTRDIVALLDQSTTTTSKALTRLALDNHLIHLNKGIWALPNTLEPFMLPAYLTAPFPSYISLQSAFYYYGMIEQIPETIYAVSLSRTKTFSTPLAQVSIHHLPPSLFFSYQEIDPNHAQIATPEKALFDFLYLQPAKTRLFTTLPEFTLPKNFSSKLISQWLSKIKSPIRRAMIENRLETVIANALKEV